MTIEIILSVAFLAAVIFFALKTKSEPNGKLPLKGAIFILLGAALALRLIMGYSTMGFEVDINCFKSWGGMINTVGYNEMYYSDMFLDYPPGYLYVLGWMDSLRILFGLDYWSDGFTLLVKLPSIIADVVCGYLIYRIGREKIGERDSCILSALYLFCPAVLINSSVWGQADSFTTVLLLIAILLMLKDKTGLTIAAAAVYGLGVISKPQMLIFAPLFLFYTIKKKQFMGLAIGVASAFAVIVLIATPFVKDMDYWFIVEKYQSTIEYYSYYTINAYNLWALLGLNWSALPKDNNVLAFVLEWAGPALATILCGVFMFKAKSKNSVFLAPAILMATVYIFSVKMHERYLFPILIFILIAYAVFRDKRFLWIFGGFSFVHYINVAYVLYLNNSYIAPTSIEILTLSLLHILLYGYLLYVSYQVCVKEKIMITKVPENKITAKTKKGNSPNAFSTWFDEKGGRMNKKDLVVVSLITVIYAFVAFWNLGANISANTSWLPKEGEAVTFKIDGSYSSIIYMPGIAVKEDTANYRVGSSILFEVSNDNVTWSTLGDTSDNYVYQWQEIEIAEAYEYVRVTAKNSDVTINEIGFKSASEEIFRSFQLVSGNGEMLMDEADSVPLYPSYLNSTYFDEIYHARTAYEHILGVEPYENTHPTLGKLIIAVGIKIFGMNPFGWRFMGALFGVLMLPVFYHLLKRLLSCSFIAAAGTILFAFDFMHFTQTRIATIDTYAVFFLLLMYDAILVFMQMDLVKTPIKKLLVPLAICGVFTGIGIASKWTAAYGAIGLAVLFFGKLIATWYKVRKTKDANPYTKKMIDLCLWCLLFFIAIPFGIYFAAFLPLTLLPHNQYDIVGRFFSYQSHMLDYHSGLVAEHYFASPWYEWPLDLRNIWYYNGTNIYGNGGVSSISALGNPILWWSCLVGVLVSVVMFIKKKAMALSLAFVGFASVYLPWVLVPRLTFIYHYFTAVPFIIICLMYVFLKLRDIPSLGKSFGKIGIKKKLSLWHIIIVAFVAVNLVMFVAFYPVISGEPTTTEYIKSITWLPNWYFG